MANKFAVVGVSGLVVCVVCLVAAAAIGGKSLRDGAFEFGDGPRCEASGTTGTRSMAWTGGDDIAIALPGDAHYQRGVGDQVVLRGDTTLLPHIQIVGNKIRLDCGFRLFGHREEIDVTLPGRTFNRFSMMGSGDLTLNDIDQPDLKISMAGSGDLEATGKTEYLDVKMAGSGDAKLGNLAADRVELHMAGSGDAEVAPKEDLNAFGAGSGDVTLRSEPKTIHTKFAGSGELVRPDSH